MHEGNDPDLDRLIAAVSNGDRVDWATETARRPDLEPLLEELRVVASVAAAHHRDAVEPAAQRITRWGPLRVLERVGGGGFGDVFRAFDPRLRTVVALKLMRSGLGQETRILQEGRRMARVRHPNVLAVHGADRHEGRAGIWTDLIEGRTLEDLLATNGPMGAEEAAKIGLDLCRALAAVHRAGLVHRDVKTRNVMRERGGRIVLMDFGAVAEREPAGEASLPEDGTPFTMAPEELRGEPATPACDLYALGVLLYRLATRRFPVEAGSYADLHAIHERGERTPLRDHRADLPGSFVRVVERALEARPQRRFTSAGEFERALMGLDVGAPTTSSPSSPGRGGLFRAGTWAGVTLAAGAMLWIGHERGWRTDTSALPQVGPSEGRRTGGDALAPRERTRVGGDRATGAVGPGVAAPPSGMVKRPLAPLAASAALLREHGGGRAQGLAPGDRVGSGDGLFLKFQAAEPVHVYVLDEDAAGEVFVLFPAPGLDLANPLAPGRIHRLPGTRDGRVLNWRVTSAGGRETVIVIATRAPHQALEREIAGFPRASLERPVAYEKVSESTLVTLRGIGGMMESETSPAAGPGPRLSDVVRRLGAEADPALPWTWQIQLENPR